MKNGITYVDAQKFEDIVIESGLKTELKRGWMKVYQEGAPNGHRIYLPLTKRVGRVDIAIQDFEPPSEVGFVDLRGERHGSVTHVLDQTLPEDEVLQNFALLLDHLKSLAPAEAKKRAERAQRAGEEKAAGLSRSSSPEAIAQAEEERQAARAKREELIRRVASEKGVDISEKAFQETDGQ
jgi:pyruvate/2-oxoglutarate dehydrogenase complex dihydrolipoamide acyltransferase (E2) component